MDSKQRLIMRNILKTMLWALALLFSMQTAFAIDSRDFISPTPTSDFIDNGDGTVTHKKTGLMWMRCAIGQTWTGSSCAGNAAKYNWNDAMALKSDFADKHDWRLPNFDELLSIVDKGKRKPATNSVIFPNTPFEMFWSSSLVTDDFLYFFPGSGGGAWIVDFDYGSDNIWNGKMYDNYVRLVRGGQWFSGYLAATNQKTAEKKAKQEADKQTVELMYEKASQLAQALKCNDALKLDREAQQLDGKSHSENEQKDGSRIGYGSCESERHFKSQLSGKNPQAMYLAAGKYERDGSSSHAKELYEAIIARFPSSVWAVKANDQLLQKDRVSDIESSNANAARRVESDSRRLAYEQCKIEQEACYDSGRKNCYRDCKSLE